MEPLDNERKRTTILGVGIDVIDMEAAVSLIERRLVSEGAAFRVFTPNPEMLMLARMDAEFLGILNSAELVVPDGIGVVLASRLNRLKIKARVPGYDLTLGVFERVQNLAVNIYFLGASPGTAEAAREAITRKFPNIRIVGTRDGYFKESESPAVAAEIRKLGTDLLLVGMSMGKQERWISEHFAETGAKVLIGVGGSFDGFSGKVKRAPVLFRKLGLEWLYRLLRQPSRIRRQLALPAFAAVAIKERLLKGK